MQIAARRSIIFVAGVLGFSAGCQKAHEPATNSVIAQPAARKPASTPDAPPAPPAKAAVPRLVIEPESVALAIEHPGLQLIARRAPAASRYEQALDVRWSAAPDGIVAIDAAGFVRPLKPGTAEITAATGAMTASRSLVVSGSDDGERSWSFQNDIVPILTRRGCNTGGCHGRADGQNGFKLSLFGYNGDADFEAITRDAGGRRIDRLRPEASLLLRKATGTVLHGGGRKIAAGTMEYETLRGWIAAGAPQSRGDAEGAAVSLALEPRGALLGAPGNLQLRAIARYAGGQTRDVTRLALYRSTNDRLLAVDESGRARLRGRGEADVIARFGPLVATSRLASPVNPDLVIDEQSFKRVNFIDDHILKRLADLKVPASPRASDATFLRRVSFDLTGQLPEPDEVKQFCADADPAKRGKKVDELMSRRDFQHFWKLKLGDLLQIAPGRFGNGAGAYEFWLENAIRENKHWDAMARELLTALGDPNDRSTGAANYALDGPDAQTRAELTARRFMGLRLRCAQCHDHPFDVWTQDDYYGMAALFAKVDAGAGAAPAMMATRVRVAINPKGSVEHKRTKQPARPHLLGGKAVEVGEGEDPRRALADWLTQAENPFFARAAVNWAWAQFFGRGLVDPVDDMSSANPAVHPELLDALARHFAESGYDLRALIKTITSSEVYGLASSTVAGNEHDDRLFSHQQARPLTAHQMADALARATQVPNVFSTRLGNRSKAIEVFNPTVASEILDTFGRCNRTETCSAVGTPQVSLRQALLLVGGDIVDGKVSHLNGYLSRLLELGPSAEEVVEFLYLRTLCRPPSAEERSHWAAELGGAASLREAAEDLFWALLNSREFAFNH